MSPRYHHADAVLLDAGGVLVLPDRQIVASAYLAAGVVIDPARVPRAHYVAARYLDMHSRDGDSTGYARAFARAVGVAKAQMTAAVAAHTALFTSIDPDVVLWSELVPGTAAGLAALARAGVALIVVSNSDGRAEVNLRRAGVWNSSAELAVIDSAVVGSAKPERQIFEIALRRVGVASGRAVHVGDMLSTDVAGARGAGLTPIHFDPLRLCRDGDHSHARTLRAVAQSLRRGPSLS